MADGIERLKQDVFTANMLLVRYGLVTGTWGNASGVDRPGGVVVIKPSGVDYASMTAGDMVVLSLDGRVLEGDLRPSSDTPTHLELYRAFPSIGGVVHTHSGWATMFAQACREIPCLGTSHADHFNGPVPVTRFLTEEEVSAGYESRTGRVIAERFAGLDPAGTPGVLVAGHGPFAWGPGPAEAAENGMVLERIAEMAFGTLQLDSGAAPLPEYIRRKHYERKHGPMAYYGQIHKGKRS